MPDFSKIWATNSPLTPYTFTDADYLDGWDFVGSAPPTKTQFDAWFKLTDEKLQWLYNQLQNTASTIYPVGSVYISFNNTDPSLLFGGTWQRIKDTFLLANGDTYAANTTGGSATKTFTVNNLPAHNHAVSSSGSHTHSATTSSNGAHTHTRGSMEITGYHDAADDDTSYSGGAFYFTSRASIHNVQQTGGESNAVINFKASRNWTGATSSNGAHTHTVSLSGGAHTHTTNNTGGSQPINILPPYTTVYVWKRTA